MSNFFEKSDLSRNNAENIISDTLKKCDDGELYLENSKSESILLDDNDIIHFIYAGSDPNLVDVSMSVSYFPPIPELLSPELLNVVFKSNKAKAFSNLFKTPESVESALIALLLSLFKSFLISLKTFICALVNSKLKLS